MAFKDDMDRILAKVRRKELQLFHNVSAHVYQSIVFGSQVTGAPGQPEDTGDLIKSYHQVRNVRARTSVTRSALFYAPIIEDNRRGAKLRSKRGGFHSIKLTRIGWRRIVAHEMMKLNMTSGGNLSMNVPMARGEGGRFTGKETTVNVNG